MGNQNALAAGHIALLGDSVFDNGAYTQGGPDVLAQLRRKLPSGWQGSLLAVDGSRIGDLQHQLLLLPAGVTHLIISVGGNDVLGSIDMLAVRARSVAEALLNVANRVKPFERAYRRVLDVVLARRLPTTVCTIYNGNLRRGELEEFGALGVFDARALRVALAPFNDAILRVAFELNLSVIDLRLVCTEPADYANPIEPSSRGAEKIALAITRALGLAGDVSGRTRIFY